MTKPNIRIEKTGVTHAASANDYAVTRCGSPYDHLPALWSNLSLMGVETEAPIDCMTCLVMHEGFE